MVVVGSVHSVLHVVLQHDARHGCIAHVGIIAIKEIGEIEVGLKLTDVAKEVGDAALVGRADRTFVAARPFPKHTYAIALATEYLGQDDVGRVVGLLTYNREIFASAIPHARC